MVIYLDTVLWNRLHDEQVSPAKLQLELLKRRSSIAVSYFVFYELLKTFSNSDNAQRGQSLIAYFAEFVNASSFVVKDNFLMLPAEIHSLKSGTPVDAFHHNAEIDGFKAVVNRIANGGFGQIDKGHLQQQKQFADRSRQSAINLLNSVPSAATRLREISEGQLPGFLQIESLMPDGVFFLLSPLRETFDTLNHSEIDSLARWLLTRPAKRFARGCARAGLYYEWRIANCGSVPKDVAEDMTHILDSVYCDVYATSEAKQTEYAHPLVTSNTRIALCPGNCAIDEWIADVVEQ